MPVLGENIRWLKERIPGRMDWLPIWFTANFGGYIGKLDPRTGKITQYPMPSQKADDPHNAVFDANGMLWFTPQSGNMVGRLDPKTGRIELKEVPTESALPYGIQINSEDVPIFWRLLRMIWSISEISRAATWARSIPPRAP
jgi:streptogramin lyase